jgi:hypothetical protein
MQRHAGALQQIDGTCVRCIHSNFNGNNNINTQTDSTINNEQRTHDVNTTPNNTNTNNITNIIIDNITTTSNNKSNTSNTVSWHARGDQIAHVFLEGFVGHVWPTMGPKPDPTFSGHAAFRYPISNTRLLSHEYATSLADTGLVQGGFC